MSDPMSQAVTEAVNENAALRSRASRLLDDMFTEAEQMLRSGSPPVKLALLKALVPAVVKSLTAEEQVDSAADMRRELEAIRVQLAAQVGKGSVPDAPEVDAPAVDQAAKPKRARK